mgnify:CR=1 FL=1
MRHHTSCFLFACTLGMTACLHGALNLDFDISAVDATDLDPNNGVVDLLVGDLFDVRFVLENTGNGPFVQDNFSVELIGSISGFAPQFPVVYLGPDPNLGDTAIYSEGVLLSDAINPTGIDFNTYPIVVPPGESIVFYEAQFSLQDVGTDTISFETGTNRMANLAPWDSAGSFDVASTVPEPAAAPALMGALGLLLASRRFQRLAVTA